MVDVTAVMKSCFVKDSVVLPATGKGPLTNKTFVVKDCISVKGHISSFGHPKWRDSHAPSNFTAPVITKLLESGASMRGLTKLDQLTYSMIGNISEGEPPINPLYPDRFTGGSSSGSASAVAGKIADFGVGGDCSGSIRVPAASCGLFAIRPTHDRISSEGMIRHAESFDVIGLLAREPSLLSDAFAVVDSTGDKKAHKIKRIAIAIDCLDLVTQDFRDAILKASSKLAEALDVEVYDMSFNEFTDTSVADLFSRLQGREIWKNRSEWVAKNIQFLAPDVKTRLENAEKWSKSSSKEKSDDDEIWLNYKEKFDRTVTEGLAIALPIISDLPPKVNSSPEELLKFRLSLLRFNSPAGLAGAPEVAIPIKNNSTGITYSVGLLGARNEDLSLLSGVVSALKGKTELSV